MDLVSDLLIPGDVHSRPQFALVPQGIVLHSTATPEATALNIRDYFNTPKETNQASAHLIVDWTEALVAVPLNEVAWHCGRHGNARYLGLELCESADPLKFHDSFLRWIDLAQSLCLLYGWPIDDAHVWSHKRISETFHETDHTDPIGYLESHQHTWDDVMLRLKGG